MTAIDPASASTGTEQKPTLTNGFRLVYRLVSEHPGPFGAAALGASIYAAATVFSASVLGWVVDLLVLREPGDSPSGRNLLVGAGAVVGIFLIVIVGVIARRWFAGMTAERVERSLRHRLAGQYVGQPLEWVRNQSTGRLLGHPVADSRLLIESLHPLPFALGVIVMVVVSSIQLYFIDPWIALLALTVFPVMILTNRMYVAMVAKPLAQMQEINATVTGAAHESFTGALVVKTLGRREHEVERFTGHAEQLRDARRHTSNVRALMDAILTSLPSLGTLAAVLLGSWRVSEGAMDTADIVTVAALFAALAIPMLVFGFLLESLAPSVVAWNRLSPVVELPLTEVPPDDPDLPTTAASIDLTDIRHRWPGQTEAGLDNVELHVEPLEFVAVVGSTGSGKSTLCEIIAGLRIPTAGSVLIDQSPLSALSPTDRARTLGLVPQQAWLFSGTIRSNVDPWETAPHADVHRALTLAAIDDWVDEQPDGLDTVIGERGVTLSGGQRQRIALARNLLHPPRVLILDDVTSAVDTVIEQRILAGLRTLETTVVLIANRPSTLQLVDRVAFLADGRFVDIDTHEGLLDNPDYAATVAAYSTS